MLIEIRGVGFVNKGAELMLHAVLQKTRQVLPKASFAMIPQSPDDYINMVKLGVFPKLWYQRAGIHWSSLAKFVSQRFRRRYGFILDNEIDVLLDSSGFCYTDQWGEKAACSLASQLKTYKRRGVKVILLPQAMGPFTSRKLREAFSYIAINADLLFPRDAVSYEHVTSLVGPRENVRQAPDFTNLVEGIPPEDPDRFRGRYCLVPNYRMVDKTSEGQSREYVAFCANCLKTLAELEQEPFILIHDFGKDNDLAFEINKKLAKPVEIITEPDALRVKGILSLCEGVISSRYHALASALNQGVPALATTWSHKYEMLMKDYGGPELCLAVTSSRQELAKHIQIMVVPSTRADFLATISRVNKVHKREIDLMWQKVFCVIGEGTS